MQPSCVGQCGYWSVMTAGMGWVPSLFSNVILLLYCILEMHLFTIITVCYFFAFMIG